MDIKDKIYSWWFPIAVMLFLFFVGPILAAANLISPLAGFYLFLSSSIFGIISTITGIRYVLIYNRRIGFPSLYCGLIQLGFVFSFALTVRNHPLITDVTTDISNPLSFNKATEGFENIDFSYPEKNIEILKEQYSGVKPGIFAAQPKDVYQHLINGFKKNSRVNITNVNEDPFIIEAYEVSVIFRFLDDFIIKIESHDNGSIVNIRSRSRINIFKGDFGVNAQRIQSILASINIK